MESVAFVVMKSLQKYLKKEENIIVVLMLNHIKKPIKLKQLLRLVNKKNNLISKITKILIEN